MLHFIDDLNLKRLIRRINLPKEVFQALNWSEKLDWPVCVRFADAIRKSISTQYIKQIMLLPVA